MNRDKEHYYTDEVLMNITKYKKKEINRIKNYFIKEMAIGAPHISPEYMEGIRNILDIISTNNQNRINKKIITIALLTLITSVINTMVTLLK